MTCTFVVLVPVSFLLSAVRSGFPLPVQSATANSKKSLLLNSGVSERRTNSLYFEAPDSTCISVRLELVSLFLAATKFGRPSPVQSATTKSNLESVSCKPVLVIIC
jgi:hypothetical protein